jgi:hypothetical protein
MPTPTYQPIATYTFPSDAADYTFTSIPSTYDDLILVAGNITASGTQTIYWQANGDATSGNYATAFLAAPNSYGTVLTPFVGNNSQAFIGSALTGVPPTKTAGFIMQINQYSQSSYPKVAIISYNQADEEADIATSMWTGTAAITSLTLKLSAQNFKTGTRFSLYGIKKAA